MSDVATRSGSRSAAGAAAWMEARWERRFGHLRRAEDLARHSLELTEGELIPALAAGTTLVGVLLDRGDAEAARAAAATLPDLGPTALDLRHRRDAPPASCSPKAAPTRRWRRSTGTTPRTAPAAG